MSPNLLLAHREHLKKIMNYDAGSWVQGPKGWYRIWGKKAVERFLSGFDEDQRKLVTKGIHIPGRMTHSDEERAEALLGKLSEEERQDLLRIMERDK